MKKTKLKHFAESEFFCKCDDANCPGKAYRMDSDMAESLDEARGIADFPFVINSAQRCPEHNKAVGGSSTSSHITTDSQSCTAVDIRHEIDIDFWNDLMEWGDVSGRDMYWNMLSDLNLHGNLNGSSTIKLLCALHLAGFNRIGIAKTFIHADKDPNKTSHVVWIY